MRVFNTADRYGSVAVLLHWLIAIAIVAMVIIGLTMSEFPPSERYQLIQFHKATGLTILALVALRLAWRLVNRTPSLPDGMPGYERLLARLTHVVLYALMIAIPLSGWILVSASEHPIGEVYGLFPIPDLAATDPGLNEAAEEVHETLAWVLIAALGLHTLAAIKHHFLDKDDVLRRMLPFGRPRQTSAH